MPEKKLMLTIKNKSFWDRAGMIFFAASFLFVVVMLAVVAVQNRVAPFGEFINILEQNLWGLPLAVLMVAAAIIAEVARYTNLLYQTSGRVMPLTAFRVAMYGRFVDSLSPYMWGGRGFQARYLNRMNDNLAVSYTIPYIQRFIKQVIFNLLFAVFFLSVKIDNNDVALVIKILVYISLLYRSFLPLTFLVFTINERFGRMLLIGSLAVLYRLRIVKDYHAFFDRAIRYVDDVLYAIKHEIKSLASMVIMILGVIVEFMASMSIPFFLYIAVGGDMHYSYILVLYMYSFVAAQAYPTPGGTGLAEFAFYAMFLTYVQSEMLFWFLLMWRLFTYYIYILSVLL